MRHMSSDALTTTLSNSIQALGRGFDVTSDIRLLYCKGASGSRLVHIDEQHTKDLVASDGVVVPNVSVDIDCSRGNRSIERIPVCSFHQMAELFNEKSGISGCIPLGSFNGMFNFTGSWQVDAAATKSLAMVGHVIPLYKVQLARVNLSLHDEVKHAVPYSWDPASLASFIESYGTHIVTSTTIGGRDVVYIRQHQASPLSATDIEDYVKDIADQRFQDSKSQTSAGPLKYKDKDVTVIFRRRGGDDLEQSHAKWADTVQLAPDVINMTLMGPKLYISPDQVTVGRKPVTGLRLCLEGSKQNRLSIHLQHLVSLPKILQPHWDAHIAIGAPKWQGPEEQDSRWFEPIKWKNFSHVSTAPIEYADTSIGDLSGVHIVTGAQLGVWDFGAKNVLHLKLLFSKVPGCTIRRSVWDHSPSNTSAPRPNDASSSISNDRASSDKKEDGSTHIGKLAKIVDMSEMSKGPQDIPGHWLNRMEASPGKSYLTKVWAGQGSFAFENMATLALAVNLVTYFNGVMHYDIADSANQVTNFSAVCYIFSILVATFADTYFGRFKAALVSQCIEFTGLALLTIQAHFPKLKPPPCNVFEKTSRCEKISGGNEVLLFTALYLLALGSSGTKAALPSHGADQYDEKDPKEARQMSSFFNFVLLAVALGGVVSFTFLVWIQDNKGWDWGFGLSTIAMLLGVFLLTSGISMYRYHVTKGSSAVIEIIQVYVASFRNRKLSLPEDPTELYEITMDKEATIEEEFLPHGDTFRFLDKAAIQTSSGDQNPWKLCRVTKVENAKIVLGLVPIFCCTIIMTLCLAQLQTFSIQQGMTMDTSITKHFNVPPASLPIIPIVFLLFLIPVYDRIIVPFLRKFTGHATGITHLQRIGVGLVLSAISMATAAVMEVKRKNVARDHGMLDAIPVLQPLPISTFWISIQFFIFGIADMFTYVGLLEFFYSEAPKGIKTMSTCFLWCSMALGYFCSTILVKIVNAATKGNTKSGGWLAGNNINRNHLELFYTLLSILSIINFCAYLFVARRYKYRNQAPA
ncbi:hypothetical protein Tsubulata_026741, partial [Turnera subulata]